MQERKDTPATALWSAAYSGNIAQVERLLAEGVDVNLWDRYGRTALSLAAEGGHIEVVRKLIGSGAWVDPHDEGSVYMSPLMCAAEHGFVEIAELLLESGADPTRHGGWSVCTAEYYARGKHRYLAAILSHAEDKWRRSGEK
jgi:ankyrin repeat protein